MKELAIKDICIKGSSALKQKELLAIGKYPVYGASGISGYLNSYQQEKPYIGIVKDGSGIGRVDFYPEKTSLIGTMQYILPKNGYNIRYIGYCLQSLDLSKYKQGAAIPHIYFRDYGDRLVKVTEDINEQQHIVSRLDSTFAHIDTLKENAEKQLREARALFQKSLSKAMEPKEGWEKCQMGDICNLSQGLAINAHTKHLLIQRSNLPLLRIRDMKDGTREIFVDEKNCPQSCIANEDEIIYTRTGTLGLVFTGMHGVLHNNCFKIMHDSKKIDKYYLIYFLQHGEFKQTIIRLASRAAQPDITHKLFKAQMIHFPPLTEQQYIVKRLDSLSSNLRKLEEIEHKVIAECDALKQALLRKVFE